MDWIPAICTLLGALAMMVYRWRKSKEPFDPGKFATTLTAVAAVVGGQTWLTFGDKIAVDGPGLIGLCIYAFLAGWGTVMGTSQAMKVGKDE